MPLSVLLLARVSVPLSARLCGLLPHQLIQNLFAFNLLWGIDFVHDASGTRWFESGALLWQEPGTDGERRQTHHHL